VAPTEVLEKVFYDVLTMPVLLRGFWASVLVSLVCSTLSVYVVLKRLAFIGQGIAHAALGGIALGVLLFVSGPMAAQGSAGRVGVDITTAIFCLAVAWLIGWISRERIISEDAAIGIFFVASMAFGVVLIALRREYTAELFSFLFGSVLAVTVTDVYVTAVLAGIIILAVVMSYRPLFLFCLDEELASSAGMPVALLHYALLSALALTIVISMKVLGVLLVAAFLVIPGATARLMTYHYRSIFILANLLGLLGVLGGFVLSDIIEDLPSGPTIVLCQFVMFVLAVAWSRAKARLARGKELVLPGTIAVVATYLVVLWAVISVGFAGAETIGAGKVGPAEQVVEPSGWQAFIGALKTGDFQQIQERIDRDPEFAEHLEEHIKRLKLTGKEESLLLDAIYQGNWHRIPDELTAKLTGQD